MVSNLKPIPWDLNHFTYLSEIEPNSSEVPVVNCPQPLQCPTSRTMADKRHPHPHTLLLSTQQKAQGLNTELPCFQPPGTQGLGQGMALNAQTRHVGILGERVQAPDVTMSQDLGTELRLWRVARHLGKHWQMPSLCPACHSKSVGGWLK